MMIKYNIELDPKPEHVTMEDSKRESLSVEEKKALQAFTKSPKDWLKKIPHVQEELQATMKLCEQVGPSYYQETEDSFRKVVDKMKKIEAQYLK